MVDKNAIPQLTLDSLTRYVEHGIPPGSFVTAVLCNDLVKAVGNADQDNMYALHKIVQYVYNELPSESWGNLNKMNAWMHKVRGAK